MNARDPPAPACAMRESGRFLHVGLSLRAGFVSELSCSEGVGLFDLVAVCAVRIDDFLSSRPLGEVKLFLFDWSVLIEPLFSLLVGDTIFLVFFAET